VRTFFCLALWRDFALLQVREPLIPQGQVLTVCIRLQLLGKTKKMLSDSGDVGRWGGAEAGDLKSRLGLRHGIPNLELGNSWEI